MLDIRIVLSAVYVTLCGKRRYEAVGLCGDMCRLESCPDGKMMRWMCSHEPSITPRGSQPLGDGRKRLTAELTSSLMTTSTDPEPKDIRYITTT